MRITIEVDEYAAEMAEEMLTDAIAAHRVGAAMLHATESERELTRIKTGAAERVACALHEAVAVARG